MPHCSRKRSESGFYHVVTKGDGGQILFENAGDREHYCSLVEEALDESKVNIHAYCLMSNHVHFLIEDTSNELGVFMKSIDEKYAMRFAYKAGRSGHIFQGRFWSEPIDSDEYFVSAIRYIHANPEHAGICAADKYPWSSYKAYVGKPSFVTTSLALTLLGGAEAFVKFHQSAACQAKAFPESNLSRHLSIDEMTRIAIAVLGRDTLYSLGSVMPKMRIAGVGKLVRAGLSVSEIARVTGMGKSSISRALHGAA